MRPFRRGATTRSLGDEIDQHGPWDDPPSRTYNLGSGSFVGGDSKTLHKQNNQNHDKDPIINQAV